MRKCSKTISAAYQEILWLFWPTTLYYLLVLKKKKDVSPENLISSQRETGWLCLQEKVISVAYDIPSRNTLPEYVRVRERERENSNSKTLFSKDCSLGSFRPVYELVLAKLLNKWNMGKQLYENKKQQNFTNSMNI